MVLQFLLSGTAVSHSFIELYNLSSTELNLKGLYLWYKSGTSAWESLELLGVIPPYSSFLVRGAEHNSKFKDTCRLKIENYDQEFLDSNGNPKKFSDRGMSAYISIGNKTPAVNPPRSLTNVEGDRTFYPVFKAARISYPVHFMNPSKNGDISLQTVNTPYGKTAVYTAATPVKQDTVHAALYEHCGWEPKPENITGELTCWAQFAPPDQNKFNSSGETDIDDNDMIKSLVIENGCPGNTMGISKLVESEPVPPVINITLFSNIF